MSNVGIQLGLWSEQLGNIRFQRFCETFENVDVGVSFAAFDLAEIGLVDAGAGAECRRAR